MTPEIIQACGVAIAAIIAAWTAWQGKQLKELRAKVDDLEGRFESVSGKFRSAVRHIRDWMRWEASGKQGPPPAIPVDIRDEV